MFSKRIYVSNILGSGISPGPLRSYYFCKSGKVGAFEGKLVIYIGNGVSDSRLSLIDKRRCGIGAGIIRYASISCPFASPERNGRIQIWILFVPPQHPPGPPFAGNNANKHFRPTKNVYSIASTSPKLR